MTPQVAGLRIPCWSSITGARNSAAMSNRFKAAKIDSWRRKDSKSVASSVESVCGGVIRMGASRPGRRVLVPCNRKIR